MDNQGKAGSRVAAWTMVVAFSVAPGIARAELAPDAPQRGFDWLFGKWSVENRFLQGRLQGSKDWKTFPAEYEAWPILNGHGNQDRFRTDALGASFEGMSIRYFNPTTQEWSIHWLDTRALAAGTPDLGDAVVGTMENGVGEFFGESKVGDIDVKVRYRWKSIDADHAQWDQSFSADDGATWEVNWVMDFTRVN